ncbi:hypothetical protein ACFFUE_03295 [Bergeyella porcorum]|uniref:hypothetical protein n=1 Tax=Bergeyella porcorum TaxID=1735111 RepID=UPI0035E5732F
MKRVLLALVIGFIAVGCRNFEKGEPDTLQEDIYEGLFEQESFCGNLLRVTKINDELPTNFELTSIKIINQPIDFQKNFQNNTLKLTLKKPKKSRT